MFGIFKKNKKDTVKEDTDKPYMARWCKDQKEYIVDNNNMINRSIYSWIYIGSYNSCEGAAHAQNRILRLKKH